MENQRKVNIDGIEVDVADVKIPWNGATAVVTIRKINYGDYLSIIDETTTITTTGTIPTMSQKIGLQRLLFISKNIVQSPFGNSIEAIQKLPKEVGEILYNEINDFNAITVEKKEG